MDLCFGGPAGIGRRGDGAGTALPALGIAGVPGLGLLICCRVNQVLLAKPLLSRAAVNFPDDLDTRCALLQSRFPYLLENQSLINRSVLDDCAAARPTRPSLLLRLRPQAQLE